MPGQKPRAPVSHTSESEHRRQLANSLNEALAEQERQTETVAQIRTDFEAADTALGERVDALQADEWSWYFPDVEDATHRLIVDTSFAKVIDEITTISEGGTATLTGKINSTALGGSANSVSTSEATEAHASDNEMGAGDDFSLTFSGGSSAEGVTVTVKWHRDPS